MVSLKGAPVKAWPTLSAGEAFGEEHTNDLHFTCYSVRTPEVPASDKGTGYPAQWTSPQPRLTKGALALMEPEDEAIPPKIEARGTTLAVDYDLPNHATWTAAGVAEVAKLMERAGQLVPMLAHPSVFYTTAKGMRLVWFLSEPVPVDGPGGLEDLLGGLIATCVQAGLNVDPTCRDWTRIFRLPRVRREDEKVPGVVTYSRTIEQAYLHQSWNRYDPTANESAPAGGQVFAYHPHSIRPLSRWIMAEFMSPKGDPVTPQLGELGQLWRSVIGHPPQTIRQRLASVPLPAQPTSADVAMLHGDAEHSQPAHILTHSIKSWITSWAKSRGRSQVPLPSAVHAYEMLYGGQSLVTDPTKSGQLHAGVVKLVNAMCFTLRRQLGNPVTPDMIYALAVQKARAANNLRTSNRRDETVLDGEVWSAVGWAYRQQVSHALIEQEHEQNRTLAEEAYQQSQLVDMSSQIEVVKAALLAAIEREGPAGAPPMPMHFDWVDRNWKKLLIVNAQKAGNAVLQITPQGQVAYSLLAVTHGALLANIQRCGHSLIQDKNPPPKSDPGARPTDRSEASLLSDYGYVTDEIRASRLITHNKIEVRERSGELHVGFVKRLPGMRTDIRPCFDSRVHEWLCCLGGKYTEKFLDWLACFHRIGEQCCGLYIQGPAKIGKGMLGKALSEMTEAKTFAPFHTVMESFQDMMVLSPFVWMDESASTAQRSMQSMMHTYKKLVTGEFNSPNSKGDKMFRIDSQWRVLITSNRDDSLKPDKDMNKDDLEAIAQRTLHIDPDAAGCLSLLQRVGEARGTAGWVEKVIPAHIAWLAEERAPAIAAAPQSRLLVMGENSPWLQAMATKTEGTNLVLRALARLLRGAEPGGVLNTAYAASQAAAMEVCEGFIRVNKSALKETMANIFESERDTRIPNESAIELSLKHLSGAKESKIRVRKANAQLGKHSARRRVWEIDFANIIRACHTAGEEVDFRATMGEEPWRAATPPEVVQEYDQATLDHRATLPPEQTAPASAPRPAYTNGHTSNGHVNGHHPAPAHAGHVPSSQPFVGAPPPLPPVPPPLPGLN